MDWCGQWLFCNFQLIVPWYKPDADEHRCDENRFGISDLHQRHLGCRKWHLCCGSELPSSDGELERHGFGLFGFDATHHQWFYLAARQYGCRALGAWEWRV